LWIALVTADATSAATAAVATTTLTRTTTGFTFPTEAVRDLYEVRARKNHRGVDFISDVLPFGRLWYDKQCDRSPRLQHHQFRAKIEVQFEPVLLAESHGELERR